MPWTLARDFAQAVQALRRERLLDAACAARAAGADKKDWERWIRETEG